jgi:predicted RNase H-like HicB family nuclease
LPQGYIEYLEELPEANTQRTTLEEAKKNLMLEIVTVT